MIVQYMLGRSVWSKKLGAGNLSFLVATGSFCFVTAGL